MRADPLILIPLLVIGIVAASVIYADISGIKVASQVNSNTAPTLTENNIASPSPAQSPTPISSPTDQPSLLKAIASSIPSPKPSVSSQISLITWHYPNATISEENNKSLLMASTDDTDVITDWYKAKIQSLGLSTKTFVKTNSNDIVENKLVGANGNITISVEINKSPGVSAATIKINLD